MVWSLWLHEKRRRKGKEFRIMRKMILALVVVLIAAPSWGAVAIQLVDEGNGVVAINYDSTGEAELVRAFALDVSVTGGTITDVTDYVVGDDNGGYGIFPANFSRYITVDGQTGEVADWGAAGYTPVADANDTGAAGALGTSAITIEMGSLYDTMAPATSGLLCKVVLDGGTEMCVTPNAVRGGIVLENAAQATLAEDPTCLSFNPICVPAAQVADYEAYVAAGADPSCWCEPYQCDGDASVGTEGFQKYRVALADLNLLVANWQKKIVDANPCADFDHKAEGFQKYRVALQDLNILVANWQKKDANLPGNCPR
jgi:hypothetical protein